MGKYMEHEMKIQELSNSLKLEICLTFDDLVLQILLLSRSFQSYRDKKLNIIKQVLIKTYYYNYLLEKTHFSLEKTFVSRELNIFARINFRVPPTQIFRGFKLLRICQKIAKCCFAKVFYFELTSRLCHVFYSLFVQCFFCETSTPKGNKGNANL